MNTSKGKDYEYFSRKISYFLPQAPYLQQGVKVQVTDKMVYLWEGSLSLMQEHHQRQAVVQLQLHQ